MTIRTRLALIFAPSLLLAACTPAAFAAALGLAASAAPAVGSALGAYAQAADDAQRAAHLPATDPEVVALRSALAALAAADAKVDKAVQPVECTEPVPVGAPLPPPAVDQAALDAALDARITKAVTAQMALRKVRARKVKPADAVLLDGGADAGDAGKDGGT